MELTEVVSPHFAVPVFGVVLCAVLVFAFGFKSPVQPPTFVFTETEEKKKKIKPKKNKQQTTNGHLPEPSVPVVSKVVAPVKSSTKASTKSEKVAPQEPVPKKEKAQKKSPVPKASQADASAKAKKKAEKEAEKAIAQDEGWTTAVPKKQRKQKAAKKEDAVEAMVALEKASVPTGEKVNNKEQKESSPEKVPEPISKPNVAPVQKKEATPPPPTETKKDDTPPKKNKKKSKKPAPLDVSELEEGEIRDGDATLEAERLQATIIQQAAAAAAQASQPAGKTAKAKSKPSKPSPTEIKQGWEFVDNPSGVGQYELEEGEIMDQSIIDALQSSAGRPQSAEEVVEAAVVDDGFLEVKAKSPKKKKKSKESRQNYPEQLPEPSPSKASQSVTSSTSKVSALPTATPAPARTQAGSPTVESHSKKPVAPAGAPAGAPAASTAEPAQQTPVTFDELGDADWQEAKPVKKKKKARREN